MVALEGEVVDCKTASGVKKTFSFLFLFVWQQHQASKRKYFFA